MKLVEASKTLFQFYSHLARCFIAPHIPLHVSFSSYCSLHSIGHLYIPHMQCIQTKCQPKTKKGPIVRVSPRPHSNSSPNRCGHTLQHMGVQTIGWRKQQ